MSIWEANFVIHFDGGTRGRECSAAAWIIEARIQRGNPLYEFPVALCGKYLSIAVSSFVAELMALESCAKVFSKLINETPSNESGFTHVNLDT